MTEQEILDLIAHGESQSLELKDAAVRPSGLAETLIAFANTNGGKVIIGVNEKTRHVSGIKKKEEVINTIHRAANLPCAEPAVNISVEEVIIQKSLVFVVTVPYQPTALFTTTGKEVPIAGGQKPTILSFESHGKPPLFPLP